MCTSNEVYVQQHITKKYVEAHIKIICSRLTALCQYKQVRQCYFPISFHLTLYTGSIICDVTTTFQQRIQTNRPVFSNIGFLQSPHAILLWIVREKDYFKMKSVLYKIGLSPKSLKVNTKQFKIIMNFNCVSLFSDANFEIALLQEADKQEEVTGVQCRHLKLQFSDHQHEI